MIHPRQISGPKELARFLDATLLRADATKAEVSRICATARELGLGGVCVNTSRVAEAYDLLEDSSVKLIAAIAWPLGAMDADAKRYETEVAVDNNAHFIEVVANLGRVKDGDRAYVLRELRDVIEAADERPVSVVFEPALLAPPEIQSLCEISEEAGAKGLVSSGDARLEGIRRIRGFVSETFAVKACGGITDGASSMALLEAGATRIGVMDAAAILRSCGAVQP